jgi:DNA-binding NtrC family response regulator
MTRDRTSKHPDIALLVAYLDGLPEPHILFDRHYRIVAANTAYRARYAADAPAIGQTCHFVSHRSHVPCDQAGESCPLAAARLSGQRERVVHLHHVGGGQEYVNVELTPVRGADGEATHFIEKMEPLQIATPGGPDHSLVGRAPAFRTMLELVSRVGETEASVLLLGESGAGKELVALALHDIGARRARPFVVVECSSFAESLFESELFGHEKGAFTGATSVRKGLVESANGGTLFLDEVGDIPLSMQVKLLRLLETGCYRRVGSTELRHTDLRIVSATHRDLRAMVAAGTFRQDLFYRLSTFPIRIPPLRERMEDLEPLAKTLLRRLPGRRDLTLAPAALDRLRQYDFPGNVRELRNVLERASIMADGTRLTAEHIAFALDGLRLPASPGPRNDAPDIQSPAGPTRPLKLVESELLQAALAAHHGSRKALAAQLGISERTLYRRLKATPDNE